MGVGAGDAGRAEQAGLVGLEGARLSKHVLAPVTDTFYSYFGIAFYGRDALTPLRVDSTIERIMALPAPPVRSWRAI